jgi:hypothetical protein
LSAELRADIQKLSGQPYRADSVKQVADGIQLELPEYVATASTQTGSQPDRVRLTFLVKKIADDDALKNNINSRYIVDSVDVVGKFKSKLSQELKADLQKMVGQTLDIATAEKLRERIRKENEPVDVVRKLRRGDTANHVKMLYDVNRNENSLHFGLSNPGYHSRAGFSAGVFDLSYHHLGNHFGTGTFKFTATNDASRQLERLMGGSIEHSTSHKDFRLDLAFSSYRAQWKSDTLRADAASPASPGLYRLRDTLSATANFKFLHALNGSAGVSLGELQMQSPVRGYRKSNAFTGSLGSEWKFQSGPGKHSQSVNWYYKIHVGTGVLGSDFVYAHHEATFDYNYDFGREMPSAGSGSLSVGSKKGLGNGIRIESSVGRTTGNAPIFERFVQGDRDMMNGWSKYEISPIGKNREAHVSAGYAYKFIYPYYEIGSVWDAGQPIAVRQSVGVIFMPQTLCTGKAKYFPLCYIPITIGIPIGRSHTNPIFMAGY